ncbi:DNA cytosine methyltransferase [Kitasatospora sp. NPDC004723]|uniref:DNA cytosine methyltransferase n=1 Tax=Kitasatospora sp. NPDC004723 TaxID=3154288 RepID=UPI0033BA41DA
MSALRVAALCAGYGGLETALEWGLGARTVVFAENDPFAAAVFAAHHPGVPNLGDITRADWRAVRDLYAPEVIVAGFPCRNISNAGRRDGIHGQWSKVWKDVAKAVRVLGPRFVFLENVAAIRSRGLDVVAQDLAQVGYDARWTCVRAGDPEIGAPHPRDRWFCVAHPADADPDDLGRHWRPGCLPEADRRDEPPHPGDPTAGSAAALRLLPTPVVADSRGTRNFTANRRPGAASNGGKTLTDVAWLLPTPKASDGPHGGPNQRDTSGRYYLPGQAVRLDERWVAHDGTDYAPAIHRWEAITGREAPCPTEAGTRGNRRLTSPFVEWMMGLPAGHVTGLGLPRTEELKILGNGVVPQQAHHAYGLLLRADEARPDVLDTA